MISNLLNNSIFSYLITILLLILSNIFMTFAWYGHLNFKEKSLLTVIFASWGIAFFEYCLHVPANRIGSTLTSPSQLKVTQEVITFLIFYVFSIYYLKQTPDINDMAAFSLIIFAVIISFWRPF